LPAETKGSTKKARIAANQASKKAELLALLTNGRESKWNPCRALEKAVQAVKLGVTPVEMQGCTALLKIADWPALEENVRLYAVTVKAPVDLVVAALCAKVEAPKVEAVQVEPPKVNPIVAPKVEPPKAGKAVTGDWPSMGSTNPARVEKRAAVAPAKPAKPAKVA